MKLCEFCVFQQVDGPCFKDRRLPQKMRCVEFTPGIERFFAAPTDYTGREQLRQMALFFGFAGIELKRVLAMSAATK